MRKVAMKFIPDNSALERNTSSELSVGLGVSGASRFLVSYEKIIPVPPGRFLHLGAGFYIVMEYCAGGNLEQDLSKRRESNPKRYLTDDGLLRLVYQVGSALRTLHSRNIIHRDVKPGNILLTGSGDYKLGDYGISRAIDSNHTKTTSVAATTNYAPPEYFDGNQTSSKAWDMYSFGCIILEVIDLCHPFGQANEDVKVTRILGGKANAVRPGLSPRQKTVRDMALRLMDLDSHSRPAIQELFLLPDIATLDH